MIVISGTIRIDPARRVEGLALVEPLIEATLQEEGCISYGFWEDPFTPGRFRLFEEWATEEAIAAHNESPHLRAFYEGVVALGDLDVDLSRYVVTEVGPVRG